MPDKWAQYAEKPGAEDKWAKYAVPATDTKSDAPPPIAAEPTMAQNFQRAYDELATPPQFDIHHPFSTGMQALGSGAIGLMSPIFHPSATLDAAAKLLGGSTADKMSVLRPMAHAFMQNPVGQGISAIPGLATAAMGGEGESLARGIGRATERGGLDLGNAAMGARGARDFQYGLNPAQGAYESGALPALSKHGTSMSLSRKLPPLGEDIAQTVKGGSPIPLERIRGSIESPLSEASAVAQGPGVGGLTDPHIEAVRASMARKAPLAERPVYGPGAGTPFTADEAMQAIMGRGPRLLPAPMEDVPLHNAPDVEGKLSQPFRLTQLNRPGRSLLQAPSASTPMASGMQAEFPERLASGATEIRPTKFGAHPGMGADQYVGGIPGERGGPGLPQGVLRRGTTYPASSEPSPLLDLRHPTATPSDLWRTIQNIDEKTRFRQNVTPEIENVNELQKGIRHNLRGALEESAPGLKGKSQQYANMKAAHNVLERTMHTDTGLNKLLQVPTYPLETMLGRGMYEAGRGIQAAAPIARVGMQSAPVASFMNALRKKEK